MKFFTSILFTGLTLGLSAQTSWTEIPTNTDKDLTTISFGSSSVGYIGGSDSLLLKTTDGGASWNGLTFTGVQFFPNGTDIVKLDFVSENVGFMTIGPYSGTYKTVDGGETWTPVEIPGNMCYNAALFFWDENNGFIGGSGCFQGELIGQYSDGVVELATINTPSWIDLVVDIDFLDSEYGLAVSANRFLKTTTGGATWDTIPMIYDYDLTSVEIINDTLAYAGFKQVNSAGYGLLRTLDAGETWTGTPELATFFYPDYHDVHQTADGSIFTAGRFLSGQGENDFSGIIFEELGGWWYTAYADHPLNAMDSYGDSTLFAVGDSGLVITNLDASLGIFEREKDENLLTVYPNPTADELRIEIDGESSQTPTSVKIWNLNGQLIRHEKVVGSKIDLSGIDHGTYVVEVILGDRVLRKRVVKI